MILVTQRFIPVKVSVGPISVGTGLGVEEFLKRINSSIEDIVKEFSSKGSVKNMGFSITQVTVSNVEGVLIVAWAQVE